MQAVSWGPSSTCVREKTVGEESFAVHLWARGSPTQPGTHQILPAKPANLITISLAAKLCQELTGAVAGAGDGTGSHWQHACNSVAAPAPARLKNPPQWIVPANFETDSLDKKKARHQAISVSLVPRFFFLTCYGLNISVSTSLRLYPQTTNWLR